MCCAHLRSAARGVVAYVYDHQIIDVARVTARNVVVVVGLVTTLGCHEHDEDAEDSTNTKVTKPAEVASVDRVYVSDEDGGVVVVIDAATDRVLERIAVGKRPRGLRVGPDPRFLFVAVSGTSRSAPESDDIDPDSVPESADGIAVIDLENKAVVRFIESGSSPESFDMSADGSVLYVSNEDAARVSFVDVTSGKVVKSVGVGKGPEGVTLSVDGTRAWVATEEGDRLDVVDLAAGKVVGRICAGQRPRSIVFTRDGARAFVSAEDSGTVEVIDARTLSAIGSIALGAPQERPRPMGFALSPNGESLFVSTGRGGAVVKIDVERAAPTHTLRDVGARPWGLGLTSDGRKLYTANGPSGDVAVVDADEGRVVGRIRTGGSPWGVAVGPAPRAAVAARGM